MITAKFGGTSLCDAAHFQMVRDILALKEERRFVVVSAPGKRFPEDIKITDRLYRCHEEARQGGNVAEAFAPVASRFQEIAAQLGLSLDLEEEFRATLWAMERGAGQDFCASRGEYFSARIMAALLNLPFLDPAPMPEKKDISRSTTDWIRVGMLRASPSITAIRNCMMESTIWGV